jgi:NAD(P)-dependent dehydrogenase (short-subunit alcohol dehydrogenase family)
MSAGNTSVRGRVVVLTGASARVGRATARELARRGARIALLARDPERSRQRARKCTSSEERQSPSLPTVRGARDRHCVTSLGQARLATWRAVPGRHRSRRGVTHHHHPARTFQSAARG